MQRVREGSTDYRGLRSNPVCSPCAPQTYSPVVNHYALKASVTTTTKKFIQQHPWCCYCGGAAAATTIDHVPAKITFAGKARPKGLEVPSCSSCNEKTRMIDQVGALFARFYPELKGRKDHDDLAKIIRALFNNDYDLMREFRKPSPSHVRKCVRMGIPIEAIDSMSMSGPRTDMYLRKPGVKLGLALHYYTTRTIIPAAGGVTAWWYPNVQILGGDFPSDIAEELGDPATLRQRKWHVGDQFTVRGKWIPNGNLGIYLSTFRNSFVTAV
jgi:hypothetical protein